MLAGNGVPSLPLVGHIITSVQGGWCAESGPLGHLTGHTFNSSGVCLRTREGAGESKRSDVGSCSASSLRAQVFVKSDRPWPGLHLLGSASVSASQPDCFPPCWGPQAHNPLDHHLTPW